MNANWTDFNDADSQTSFDLIPKGTIVPVRMIFKPGGYDDHNRGWTGGYATRKPETGAIYLSCEFVITEGKFARRKVWSLIGLFSQKGPEWGNMGRSFIRAILNSSRGISDQDNSPQAAQARRISGLADLDGIEFLAKIDVEKDQNSEDKNVIKFAITPDHKEYSGQGTGGRAPQVPPTSSVPTASTTNTDWPQNNPAVGQQPSQQNWQPQAQQQPPQAQQQPSQVQQQPPPVQQQQPAQQYQTPQQHPAADQGVPSRPVWAQ